METVAQRLLAQIFKQWNRDPIVRTDIISNRHSPVRTQGTEVQIEIETETKSEQRS